MKRKKDDHSVDYGDKYNRPKADYINISSEKTGAKSSKKRKIRNILILVLSSVCFISGSALMFYEHSLNLLNYKSINEEQPNNTATQTDEDEEIPMTPGSMDASHSALLEDPMVFSMMLFGTNDRINTDTNMLLCIDSRHKKLKIISLLRDTYVKIPGYSDNKLNAAYAFGREKLAVETIQNNFGIKISRYATVDFDGFIEIVDTLGGVDIELTKTEAAYINEKLRHLPPLKEVDGMQHLSGVQALNYSRDRDSGGDDYGRTERQRKFLKAMISKMKTSNPIQLAGIVAKIGPKITTNLKKSEITKLFPKALTYMNYTLEEYRLPERDNVYSANKGANVGLAEVIKDWNQARYNLAKFLFEDLVK